MSWHPPPRGKFKVNFHDSVQSNKAGIGFVVKNDICGLIGACTCSIPIVCSSVLDIEIRGL